MLRSLKIENFRCFQTFVLEQLGRLNLLVGTNNSGKTSILEAVKLLTSQPNHDTLLETLQGIMIGRGEYIWSEDLGDSPELDIRHLFYGHKIDVGSKFFISSNSHYDGEGITVSVESRERDDIRQRGFYDLFLKINWAGKQHQPVEFLLSDESGLSLGFPRRTYRHVKSEKRSQLITSSSLKSEEMIDLFDQVVLTPREDVLIKALQTIEPNIERIASVSSDRYKDVGSRGGFIVRLSQNDQRIPIGSMGDGIWRMLGLTLAMVNAKNGILLIDEIDTGLHFSVMSDMWKLIWETAKRLNVQVFATTHNSDCWTSLATIACPENSSAEGITIHRIEKDKPSSVIFTDRQIVIAAERGIEVR